MNQKEMNMPRIVKDYSKRRRTPNQSIAPSEPADRAKMSGTAGSATNPSHSEGMIAHDTAVRTRASRTIAPNSRLGKK